MQVHGVQARHHDDAGEQVAHLQFHMDDARERAGQRAGDHGCRQRQQGRYARLNHQRGDSGAEGEGRIDGHIREVQNFEGDVHAQSENGIDETLLQDAQKKIHADTSGDGDVRAAALKPA